MFRLKAGLIVTIVVLSLLLTASLAWAEEAEGTRFDLSGSLGVGMNSQVGNDDFLLGDVNIPSLGSDFSLRTDLQIIPNDQVKVKLRLSYQNISTLDSPPNDMFLLSRGYIDFSPGDILSLRWGKQRLAWGTGYAWNPTDLLDLPRNAFTASDDPEGIMAVRTDLNFGPVTGQLVLIPGADWDTSGKAVRIKASPGGVDLTLGWLDPVLGANAMTMDFAGSVAGIGFHGEASYQSEGNNPWVDKDDIFNYLLGIDYNLPGGWLVALEYYHNDTAFADAAEALGYIGSRTNELSPYYDPYFDPMAFLTDLSNNGGITQDHFFLRVAKSFGENANTEILLVLNANDFSCVAQPKFEYTWKQTTTLYIKGLVIQGDTVSEVNLLPIAGRWEFGFKVNF